MSAHTPGPWVIGNTDHLLFGRQRGNGMEPIGFVYGPSFADRSEVGKRALADASLIAAAPEMLAALQAYQEWTSGKADADIYINIVAQMRAAIAKATGADQVEPT